MINFFPVFGFLPSVGLPEMALILCVVFIVFGAGKLPEAGKAIGKSITEFKKARNEDEASEQDKEN